MKQLVTFFLAAPLAAACAGTPAASAETRAGPACDAQVAAEWRGEHNKRFRATASTSGPNCAQAVVLLVVRDSAGEVVWTDALGAAHVMGLSELTTRVDMTGALADWVGKPATYPQTTADLTPWAQTSGQLGESEFPFMPEPWIDEEYYERLAGAAKPMFCYIQGMESLACLIEFDDRLEKIGVQSFPG